MSIYFRFITVFWLLLATGSSTFAQDQGLRVTLQDVQGAPVSGASIQIVDGTGSVIATATTTTNGTVTFAPFAAVVIRIKVQGFLANGTPLLQLGDDAKGLSFVLDTPTAALDLRVERDGSVLPDPSTMLALDTLSDTTTRHIPEAPSTGQAAQPTAGTETHVATAVRDQTVQTPATTESESANSLLSFLVIGALVLVATGCAIALWKTRRGTL